MEIGLRLNSVGRAALERIKKAPTRIRVNFFLVLLASVKVINRMSRTKYLSGPRPTKLDRITGNLANLQGYTVEPWKGNIVEGKVGYGVGMNATRVVKYDWIHERGFHGSEHVRAHTRMQTQIFGVPVVPFPVRVSAYSRVANMPARPYLGPPTINEYIKMRKPALDAIRKGLKGLSV